MKISKNKTMFTRLVTAMISTLMLMVVFSFSAVSVMAMAANEAQEIVTVAELPTADTTENLEVTPICVYLKEKRRNKANFRERLD